MKSPEEIAQEMADDWRMVLREDLRDHLRKQVFTIITAEREAAKVLYEALQSIGDSGGNYADNVERYHVIQAREALARYRELVK